MTPGGWRLSFPCDLNEYLRQDRPALAAGKRVFPSLAGIFDNRIRTNRLPRVGPGGAAPFWRGLRVAAVRG